MQCVVVERTRLRLYESSARVILLGGHNGEGFLLFIRTGWRTVCVHCAFHDNPFTSEWGRGKWGSDFIGTEHWFLKGNGVGQFPKKISPQPKQLKSCKGSLLQPLF